MEGLLSKEFRAYSARIGRDLMQIQGAGGNTSIKSDGIMWIKASGKELAQAIHQEIFVAVDRQAVIAEIEGKGDGSCLGAVLNTKTSLRPSIETTFHAALNWPVVAHSHSVAAIAHAISPEGRLEANSKLFELAPIFVPYKKPGLPLTLAILDRISKETRVIVLENHGLVVCGNTVSDTEELMAEVEARLLLQPIETNVTEFQPNPYSGYEWALEESWLANNNCLVEQITSSSYYPDHVVFLGPGMSTDKDSNRSVIMIPNVGIQIKVDATTSQRVMLRCLFEVFRHQKPEWNPEPIGRDDEAALMNWDAEKYRQQLAQQS